MTDEPLRWLAALALLLAWAWLCTATWQAQRRKRGAARQAAAALQPAGDGAEPVLVAHASQTGTAEHLAWQTARLLHAAGVPARLMSLAELSAEVLATSRRALILISSYGEGDPPDTAAPFARRVMAGGLALDGLQVGVLALGDSGYRHYCGFGRRLDGWLLRCGARPLFPRIEVDKGDPAALRRWRQQVARLAGAAEGEVPDDAPTALLHWQLAERRLLNPGSAGEPVYHLEVAPPAGQEVPEWEAGDLARLAPPGDPDRPRDYSIASLPADGRLHLLVRRARRPDGTPGAASGWLTQDAAIGDTVSLQLRAHPGFRIGGNAGRPLVLVGNGTGLAGLRAHLKARAATRGAPTWLVYGERNAARDALYADELAAWRESGLLTHLDLAYSRDGPSKRYVQHALQERAERLRDWVGRDAAIYVCGSLEGMAGGVEQALVEILGRDGVDALVTTGRLRRDVY